MGDTMPAEFPDAAAQYEEIMYVLARDGVVQKVAVVGGYSRGADSTHTGGGGGHGGFTGGAGGSGCAEVYW